MKPSDVLQYAGYSNISTDTLNVLDETYEGDLTTRNLLDQVDVLKVSIPSNIKNLKPHESINLYQYMSYHEYLKLLVTTDLSMVRSIRVAEESIQLNNQTLEYLCSGGNVEELKIAEERHTITALPVFHLSKLRNLFICNDKHIKITNTDLCRMPNIQLLGLSWNNTITNEGLNCLPNLLTAALFSNNHVFIGGVNTLKIKYIISSTVEEEQIPKALRSKYHYANTMI